MRLLIALIIACSATAAAQDSSCWQIYRDESWRDPTRPSTPNFKITRSFEWKGRDWLAVCDGKGVGIYNPLNRQMVSDSGYMVCGRPCPGMLSGDYDNPVRRMAICNNAQVLAVDGVGLAGGGGAAILIDLDDIGRPYPWPNTGTKRLLPLPFVEGGTATIMHRDTQYFISTGWPGGCDSDRPRPYPTLWKVQDGQLQNVQCLPHRFIVYGGEMVSESILYLVDADGIVTAWHVSRDNLSFAGVMPISTKYFDGAGLHIHGNLLVSGSPRVMVWDISIPLSPVLLWTLEEQHTVGTILETGQHRLLWTTALASSSSSFWCLDDPINLHWIADVLVIPEKNMAWNAGSPCSSYLCTGAEQMAVALDTSCYPCANIFADGFESGDTSTWSMEVQ